MSHERAVAAVEGYGEQRYAAGFAAGIAAAWKIWRWVALAQRPPRRADWVTWSRGAIEEAYRLAGLPVPAEGEEP